MAIALDAFTNGTDLTFATSFSFSHTVSGSDICLFVSYWGSKNATDLSSATVDGVAMTKVLSVQIPGDRFTVLFAKLLGNAGGSHTIVVSDPDGTISVSAVSYTGVSQTGFPDNSASASGTWGVGSAPSVTITPSVNNCWAVAALKDASVFTPNSGTTLRSSTARAGVWDSGGAISPASAYTLSGAAFSSYGWALPTVTIAPAGGGGGGAVGPLTRGGSLAGVLLHGGRLVG